MVKIVLADGTAFEAASDADMVSQLKLDDWTGHSTAQHYKKNMARRVKNFHGVDISYSNNTEFLDELLRIGFIRLVARNA